MPSGNHMVDVIASSGNGAEAVGASSAAKLVDQSPLLRCRRLHPTSIPHVSKETHSERDLGTIVFWSMGDKEQTAAPSRLGVPRRSSPSVSPSLATETTSTNQPKGM